MVGGENMDLVYKAWQWIQYVYNQYGPDNINSLNNAARM